MGASQDVEVDAPELPSPIDEEEQRALLQEARDEGFAQGQEQGRADAALEWQQKFDDYLAGQGAAAAQQLSALATAFERGLTQSQQMLAQGVLDLACDIARQVVRQELRGNNEALRPVIQEAIASLVADGQPIFVRLHPEDEHALGPALRSEFAGTAIQWIADADVAPGGCLVEQAGTVIDGKLEKRWQRAVAPLGIDAPWQTGADDGID
ncbi:flagellar assembly protein FliH [Simplicispira suum]|uniref:Flagellar assembly protein FliH n=2 Tax=Simplicispira suum TaxID=2109915 RepID=A0A2S0N4V9_9BURK|nr:flagellar assembly protein FliH [Simplicispira suum]